MSEISRNNTLKEKEETKSALAPFCSTVVFQYMGTKEANESLSKIYKDMEKMSKIVPKSKAEFIDLKSILYEISTKALNSALRAPSESMQDEFIKLSMQVDDRIASFCNMYASKNYNK